jgi:hypothetical protein
MPGAPFRSAKAERPPPPSGVLPHAFGIGEIRLRGFHLPYREAMGEYVRRTGGGRAGARKPPQRRGGLA